MSARRSSIEPWTEIFGCDLHRCNGRIPVNLSLMNPIDKKKLLLNSLLFLVPNLIGAAVYLALSSRIPAL